MGHNLAWICIFDCVCNSFSNWVIFVAIDPHKDIRFKLATSNPLLTYIKIIFIVFVSFSRVPYHHQGAGTQLHQADATSSFNVDWYPWLTMKVCLLLSHDNQVILLPCVSWLCCLAMADCPLMVCTWQVHGSIQDFGSHTMLEDLNVKAKFCG